MVKRVITAANNLVFQSVSSIAFEFPLLLLMPLSDDSTKMGFSVLAIISVMFIVYNILLFRRFIFKKKKTTQTN